ncbi:hypothetical protein KKF84_21975, partial [Myxococcota bacterium]|nr:hypothetical protein [Myxococcota bacterium]
MQTISFRAQSLNSGGGLINWLWMLVVAASLGFAPIGCDDSSSNNVNNNNDAGVDGDIDTVEDADADGDTDGQIPECITATGTGVQEPGTWQDGSESATIHTNGSGCTRAFAHSTTQFLRDNNPANPRMYSEQAGWPAVSSTNTLFDALYALALEEVRENSVPAIQDGAYNGGAPIECPAGGCFETGRLWKFVWT